MSQTDETPKYSEPPRWRRFGWATVAIAAVLIGAGIASIGYLLRPPTTAVPTLSCYVEGDAANDLTRDLHLEVVQFPARALAVAAHPKLPAFVVADTDLKVVLASLDGVRELHTTRAPAHWLHISADGDEAVVCDTSGDVTIVPITADSAPRVFELDAHVARAFALGDGTALCISANDHRSWAVGKAYDWPSDAGLAMPATSDGSIAAWETEINGRRSLVVGRPDDILLTRGLEADQNLAAIDVCLQRSTILIGLTDRTMIEYVARDGGYEIQNETRMPRAVGTPTYAQLSPEGETAWIGADELAEWDLNKFQLQRTAAIPMEQLMSYRVHFNGTKRILLSSLTFGAVWR
ncbi:MAG: hypothetical protein AAF916_01530 [Planctomycetota bacterium]